jgi:hypothetical protein
MTQIRNRWTRRRVGKRGATLVCAYLEGIEWDRAKSIFHSIESKSNVVVLFALNSILCLLLGA